MGIKAKEEQSAKMVGEEPSGTKTGSDIYVGAVAKRQRRLSRKLAIMTLAALLVAAGLGVAYFHNNSQSSEAVQKVKTAQQQAQGIELAYNTSKTKDAIALNSAETQLAKLEANAPNAIDKATYALAQIELYSEAGDSSAALVKALAADKAYHIAATAAAVGGAYDQQGNYAKAAEYYQLAADRSPKTADPKRRSAYNDYLLMKKSAEALL